MILLVSAQSALLNQRCVMLVVHFVEQATPCVDLIQTALPLPVVVLTYVTLFVSGHGNVLPRKAFFQLVAASMVDVIRERRTGRIRGCFSVSSL